MLFYELKNKKQMKLKRLSLLNVVSIIFLFLGTGCLDCDHEREEQVIWIGTRTDIRVPRQYFVQSCWSCLWRWLACAVSPTRKNRELQSLGKSMTDSETILQEKITDIIFSSVVEQFSFSFYRNCSWYSRFYVSMWFFYFFYWFPLICIGGVLVSSNRRIGLIICFLAVLSFHLRL